MVKLNEGPVGIRWKSTQVRNSVDDQRSVIDLLARIRKSDGGMLEDWTTRPAPGVDRNCPKDLATAILNFQTHWYAKRALTVADGVVDPTGTSLRLMNQLALPEQPGANGVVDEIVKIDIVVAIVPFAHRDDVPLSSYANWIERNLKPFVSRNHKLKVLTPDCSERFNPAACVKEIQAAINDRSELGKLCLYGVSLGGLLTIQLAKAASVFGRPVDYVGVSDAAFFHQDSVRSPSFYGEKEVLMKSSFSAFNAKKKENYYQHKGNHVELSGTAGSLIWQSKLNGEIHGHIQGFHNEQEGNLTKVVTGSNDNDFHVDGAQRGENKLLVAIGKLLQAG